METGYEEFVAGAGDQLAAPPRSSATRAGASTRSKSGARQKQQQQQQQQQQFDKLQAKLAKLAKHKKLATKTGAVAAAIGSGSPRGQKGKKKQQQQQQQQKAIEQYQQQHPSPTKKQQKQLKERQSAAGHSGATGAAAAAAYQNDDALYDFGPETQMYLRMQSAGTGAAVGGLAKERKQAKPIKLKSQVRQTLEALGLGSHQHHQMMTVQQHQQQQSLSAQQQLQQYHHHHQQFYPSEQRKVCAMNATHLKNMLKLPKAHRWVFYEWFYSNLDRPLFLGPNDFQNCLRDTFPLLRTRRLTRAQWSLIRKLLGKPRRCSPAFFAEERRALHDRRDKIRSLQRRRALKEGETVRELPDDLRVPMPLIIGTSVVARVRYPTDGLYAGIVDAIDGYNHCYRVTFDKLPLGTRSIPDYEVRSVVEQESIPLASYKANHQPSRALFTPARLLAQSAASSAAAAAGAAAASAGGAASSGHMFHVLHHHGKDSEALAGAGKSGGGGGGGSSGAELSPLVAASVSRSARVLGLNEEDTFSGYAIKFLLIATRLMKMVERKRRCLDDLGRLNDQAELLVTAARPASLQLVHDYSACLLGLRRLNADLRPHLAAAGQLAAELGHERGLPVDPGVELKAKAGELAVAAVGRAESRLPGAGPLRNLKSADLVTQLVALLALLRRVAERRPEEQDFGPVRCLLAEVKASLHSGNVGFFENSVEVHLQAVLARLDEGSPLHPFHLRAASNYF